MSHTNSHSSPNNLGVNHPPTLPYCMYNMLRKHIRNFKKLFFIRPPGGGDRTPADYATANLWSSRHVIFYLIHGHLDS